MSLAEPRKRRKNPMHSINLSAQNHWTNDDSKFGQRMLEKFGWSKGSGLGKNKQGISENIKVQQKVTPTGLGFVANNADDWFKAGEDYSRLLSQLTEKFDQYQALSEANDDTTSKKSLVQNSLNSKSRVHYHKFTKGKDLTQYKKEELACILGKGVKDDDQSSSGLDMIEYFKTKRESKKLVLSKYDASSNEDIIDDKINERITAKEDTATKTDDHEINTIPPKKKKLESKLTITETDILPHNEYNNVELKKKKKKLKTFIVENAIYVEQAKKKKKKSIELIIEDVNVEESNNSEHDKKTMKEQESELVLTHKYQHLVDLLIENSSAGKKYCKDMMNSSFEKEMKEFEDIVKHECSTTVGFIETEHIEKVSSYKPIVLNPDNENFIKDFEAQKFRVLESIAKRQEVSKYINEKSMFIAKHGNVLFFGSNINDINGYGNW